ncbi:MAG: hypothetical protein SAL07_11070 [Oscillatoria sp. PMC 1051.18]|uniref:hypothetical protein n=1 Tax=Oscillatoria salina TaxID=331517 RepID=UPI0013B72F56|nr:hypothetical protein [Oscillatoria salina]MBZ8181602.1 hypothetical protein [Oscillatoria salina IIICB1]MEC4891623.1 hypothetical protein [Oscillatoria sp. PMC 1050.18]MEC5030446.1 hypothetical protein [Oscillatoria sp. PMC 1051.18]NET89838.1 hypothetical protein [Kamptonema sp. SIO1D9]
MPRIYVGKSNVKVWIKAAMPGVFGSLGSGGVRTARTGSDGWAEISFSDFGSSYSGEIHVDSKLIHQGKIDDTGTYYA